MWKKIGAAGFVIILALIGTALYSTGFLTRPDNLPRASVSNNPTPSVEPQNIPRLSVIAENLSVPWDIAFLPDNTILFTQRTGEVIHIESDGTTTQLIDIPVAQVGESGLHGIAIHPNYESNNFVYVYYTFSDSGGNNMNRVSRFTLQDNSLTGEETIIDNIPGARFHDGGRIRFGPDDMLYITTGDATDPSLSQNEDSLAGKILRVNADGSTPDDNPFSNSVYSLGHRNPQGIDWDDEGTLWETEHGPTAFDELNRIEKGANYGWPQYTGDDTDTSFTPPVIHSNRQTWAPAGLAYVEGSFYFAGLRGNALYEYNPSTQELTSHLSGELGRIRAVTRGPDNMLYISTSNRDGRGVPSAQGDRIIRVNPTKL